MARGVADPRCGAGVQRCAVADLPALEARGGRSELLVGNLRGWTQLKLGSGVLAVCVDADAPAQKAHRIQIP
jgi:hypothetical protein